MEDYRQSYRFGEVSIEDAIDMGICDEKGYEISPFRKSKPYGPGICPKCKKFDTELKTGKYGKFYGCKNFPNCNGSRSYI
jgi:ssDNA-binding Zn-finger/Zn-ribbon topoisomerase 1